MPMIEHSGELLIPPEAHGDARAVEVLRAWIVNGGLHCSLKPSIWPEPGNWGILLADVARHVADAFQRESGQSPIESLERIRLAFQAELDSPTDKPAGAFHHEH
jgi:hypothetical protein